MNNYRYRMTDEELDQLSTKIKTFAEEVKDSFGSLIDIIDQYFETDYYEPILEMRNKLVESYKGNLMDTFLNHFEIWTEAQESVVHMAESSGSGEETVERAQEYQSYIEEVLDSMKDVSIEEMSPRVADFSKESLSDLMTAFGKAIEEKDENLIAIVRDIQTMADENVAISGIPNLIKPIQSSFIEFFKDIFEKAKKRAEDAGDVLGIMKSGAENNADMMKSELSGKTKEITQDVLDLIDELFPDDY